MPNPTDYTKNKAKHKETVHLKKGHSAVLTSGVTLQPQRSRPAYRYHIVTNAEVECGLHPPEMRGQYLIDGDKAVVARRAFAFYSDGKRQARQWTAEVFHGRRAAGRVSQAHWPSHHMPGSAAADR